MSISDKVILANPTARQIDNVDSLKFSYATQGSVHFAAIESRNIFAFGNSSDCVAWVNSLNSCMLQTLTSLRSYYDSKVSQILA